MVIDISASRPWSAVVWHHSATKDGVVNDYAAIRRYHMETKGWRDVGYNWLIEREGGSIVIQNGRSLSWEGGHCVGWNKTALGICVVGNFDLAAPDDEILRACRDLGRAIMAAFPQITPERHHFHNAFSAKTCPGRKFPPIEEFRRMLGSVYA